MGEESLALFRPDFNRSIRIESRAERLTAESGSIVLREVLERLGIIDWLVGRLVDCRDPELITHPLSELLRTAVILLGQGWRDGDDADTLRDDGVLRLAVSDRRGVSPLEMRPRDGTVVLSKNPAVPDGLASQPTLSRLVRMLSTPENRDGLRGALLECAARRLHAMRGGILIVGSLLWDQFHERDQWRRARLRIDDAVYVKLPIRYGRRSMSRGGTFTMTFALNALPGQGVLVPCSRATEDMAALIEEAEALWKAEDRRASAGSIGASWGCVGVSFRAEPPPGDWLRAWAAHFQAKGCAVSSVSRDGLLRIPWPLTAADGTPVNVDVILGTATKARRRPQPLRRSPMPGWARRNDMNGTSSKTCGVASEPRMMVSSGERSRNVSHAGSGTMRTPRPLLFFGERQFLLHNHVVHTASLGVEVGQRRQRVPFRLPWGRLRTASRPLHPNRYPGKGWSTESWPA